MALAVIAQEDPAQAGGLTGWVAGVIQSLGEVGVGLLVLLENIVPPVPSEVVLAMAGYLAGEGQFNVVLAAVAATVGSVVGALLLYGLGAAIGEDRLKRWLDHIPLVDLDDLEKADRWFERYGKWAILIGRIVPVVRSLVSIPAGANRMPVGQFVGLTALGSGVWNSIFLGFGYALGSQWQQINRYSHWLDIGLYTAFALLIASWVVKRVRKRRQNQFSR
jgi:membrane protein DedA with SNARE-associated domain